MNPRKNNEHLLLAAALDEVAAYASPPTAVLLTSYAEIVRTNRFAAGRMCATLAFSLVLNSGLLTDGFSCAWEMYVAELGTEAKDVANGTLVGINGTMHLFTRELGANYVELVGNRATRRALKKTDRVLVLS